MRYLKFTFALTAVVGLAIGIAFSPQLALAESNRSTAQSHGACVHTAVACGTDAGACPSTAYSARNSVFVQNATSGMDLNITIDGQTPATADAGIYVPYPLGFADEVAPNVAMSCRCSINGTVLVTECP